MEILEIFTFLSLLFIFNYENVVGFVIFYYLAMYYRANKYLLVTNPYPLNMVFLFSVMVLESLIIYFKIGLIYFLNYKLNSDFYSKLEKLNNYYLEKKNNLICYIKNKIKSIYFYLFVGKNHINKIKSDQDAILFLNSLKLK